MIRWTVARSCSKAPSVLVTCSLYMVIAFLCCDKVYDDRNDSYTCTKYGGHMELMENVASGLAIFVDVGISLPHPFCHLCQLLFSEPYLSLNV